MYETLIENMSGMTYACHEYIALVYLVKIMVKHAILYDIETYLNCS